jgi:hypothetical protein
MNTFNIVVFLLIILLYFIIINFLTKSKKLKQIDENINTNITKESYFKLYTEQIENEKHFICINNSTGRVYLSLNENNACIMRVIETDDKKFFALKEKNSPCYIHYSYPTIYQQKYDIYANAKSVDISVYLKFIYSKKHRGFYIKFINEHYMIFNPDDLLLYSTANKYLDKKLVVNIQEI